MTVFNDLHCEDKIFMIKKDGTILDCKIISIKEISGKKTIEFSCSSPRYFCIKKEEPISIFKHPNVSYLDSEDYILSITKESGKKCMTEKIRENINKELNVIINMNK